MLYVTIINLTIMKKFLLLIFILLISNSFVCSETLKAKAVRELYTSRENSVIKLKVLKPFYLGENKIDKDFFITGTITNIEKSKHFYKSATFDFTPISYEDLNGNEYKIETTMTGKFKGKIKPDMEKSPFNLDYSPVNFMPYGSIDNSNKAFSGVKEMIKEDVNVDINDKALSTKDDMKLVEIDMDEVLKFEF